MRLFLFSLLNELCLCHCRNVYKFISMKMYWRRQWHPTPVLLPGESQGWRSLVGCRLWGRTVGYDWSDLAAAAAWRCMKLFLNAYPFIEIFKATISKKLFQFLWLQCNWIFIIFIIYLILSGFNLIGSYVFRIYRYNIYILF